MANQNPQQTQGNNQQGDNRKAGDLDGNRGAKPKSSSQGVNESAANQPDGTQGAGKRENPEPDSGPQHSEAEALYRDRAGKNR